MQTRNAQSNPPAGRPPARKHPPRKSGAPVVAIVLIALVVATGVAIVLPGFLLANTLASKCWTLSGGTWHDSLAVAGRLADGSFTPGLYVARFGGGFGQLRTTTVSTQCGGLALDLSTSGGSSATVLRVVRNGAECSTAGPSAAELEVDMMRGLLAVSSLTLDGDRLTLSTPSGARFVFGATTCAK